MGMGEQVIMIMNCEVQVMRGAERGKNGWIGKVMGSWVEKCGQRFVHTSGANRAAKS